MAELDLTLLGGFEARLSSGVVAKLPGQKDRALLAFLAISAGDAHPRERLAGLLWSERSDQQARDSLKQSLLRVRRGLGPAASNALRADRQSIALDRTDIHVDVLSFQRLAEEKSIDALARAASLYRGDLLDGIAVRDPAFEDWLMVERQRLRHLLERALASLMGQALDAGNREMADNAARRLLLIDPLSEAAHRTLMQVHAAEGQTSLAFKVFEQLRGRLHRELCVAPEAATIALYDRIRRERSVASTAAEPPARSAVAIGSPLAKLGPDEDVARQAPLAHALAAATESTEPPATTELAVRERPAMPKASLAVLPFLSLNGDADQQHLSDGITEDIITELSRFSNLFVLAGSASSGDRGGELDLVRVGRELGVDYLAEGSVRRIGDRIRVNAQLIEAGSGKHLWAEKYDREAAELLAAHDDIVLAIATALGYRVEAAGRDRSLRLSPEALSAHDLALRSDALNLRFTKKDNVEARRLAERAVELDPHSALAHVQLSWAHCMDHLFGWTTDRKQCLNDAIAVARHAVLLDDMDSRARTVLGFGLLYRREYEEARAILQTAIALNPNDVEARATYSLLLTAIGDSEAALEQLDIAKRRKPFELTWVSVARGIASFTGRRYDEAIAALLQAPHHNNEVRFWLTASYAGAGRLPAARTEAAEFLAEAERDVPLLRRSREDWEAYLRGFMEYRDQEQFEHLFAALHAAGLEYERCTGSRPIGAAPNARRARSG
jgi:TolB-like protein/DNA-binding SARP family transcriptional activator